MKKLNLVIILFFFIAANLLAQCPGNIGFFTQEDVDNFIIDYPNCKDLPSHLVIGKGFPDSDITNLDAFQNIETIAGILQLQNLTELTTLSGFDNLTDVGGDLNFTSNTGFTLIDGLENLSNIGGDLNITSNSSLISIIDLTNLVTIGGDLNITSNPSLFSITSMNNLLTVGGDLEISSNPSLSAMASFNELTNIQQDLKINNNGLLPNLNGFGNLISVDGSIRINANDKINNISGFNQLTTIGGSFGIQNNDKLTNLNGFANLDAIGDFFTINSNDLLTDIGGFNNLSTLGNSLSFDNNDMLNSIDGFNSLGSIGGDFMIYHNDFLTDISGLSNVESILGAFHIYDNDVLTDLNGLNNLATIESDLFIHGNNSLSNLQNFSNVNHIGENLLITSNNVLNNLTGLSNSSFDKNLTIQNNDALSHLNGLENLTTLMDINISNNDMLNNLDGLQNLTAFEDFIFDNNDAIPKLIAFEDLIAFHTLNISNNDALSHLNGFQNLKNLHTLIVENNDVLTDLNELQNLTSLHTLNINGNDAITHLNAFDNLTAIYSIFINSNNALYNINGIRNISTVGSQMSITENQMLEFCSIQNICNFLVNSSFNLGIYNNAPGCNNELEVSEGCEDIGVITISTFFDINENGLLDNQEPLMPNSSATIEPGGLTVFGNGTTGATKYLFYGDYIASHNITSSNFLWNLTSNNSPYEFTLESANQIESVFFGISPTENISDINLAIANGLPRCNELVTFDIIAYNQGTTLADGVLWLNVDENIQDVIFIDSPDFEEPLRYGWNFDNLLPGQNVTKQIILQLPGPPDLDIGEWLSFYSETIFNDINGQDQIAEQEPLDIQVQCAFDPNDKLVQPVFPENYALIDDELIYTVRFQNTGNAEAYDVRIEDEIDPNLDLSTFRVITSSHKEILSTYLINNTITFDFQNIFLPDSTTNFDASQGYVMYSIRPFETLDDFTIINNTASIYFDFNPAIVTNTTQNNMVATFDADGDGFELWSDCNDNDFNFHESLSPGTTCKDGNPNTLHDVIQADGCTCLGIEIPLESVPFNLIGNDIFSKLTISPNPAKDEISLSIQSELEQNVQILLYNINGQIVLSKEIHIQSGHNTHELNIESFNAGVYQVILQNENNQLIRSRFVKL